MYQSTYVGIQANKPWTLFLITPYPHSNIWRYCFYHFHASLIDTTMFSP